MYSRIGNSMFNILPNKIEIGIKNAFDHFDQKQKCSVFIFVQYISIRLVSEIFNRLKILTLFHDRLKPTYTFYNKSSTYNLRMKEKLTL